jgi:large subunit ribosomal protein L7/L12
LTLLASGGAAKLQVVKEVKTLLNLGLKEAKDLVDAAPAPLKLGVSKEEAADLKEKLEAAGAQVEIK